MRPICNSGPEQMELPYKIEDVDQEASAEGAWGKKSSSVIKVKTCAA